MISKTSNTGAVQALKRGLAGSLVAALVVLGAGCGNGNGGESLERGTLVTIAARGEASSVPDVAEISAGVITEAGDSRQAMEDNARQMEKLMRAIDKAGIEKRDIQTTGIRLSPRYARPQPGTAGNPPNREISAYIAHNTLRIKVREIGGLGEVIDHLAEAGANNIHGPSFSIGEPGPLLEQARAQALEEARQRAESYAEALGMEVARIVSIGEGGNGGAPRPMMRAEMAAADSRTPVSPGETTVAVDLQLVFELRD